MRFDAAKIQKSRNIFPGNRKKSPSCIYIILSAEKAARLSMGRVRADSNISYAQTTAMTDGSAYRCFMIKTLGPVVMLPANFLA